MANFNILSRYRFELKMEWCILSMAEDNLFIAVVIKRSWDFLSKLFHLVCGMFSVDFRDKLVFIWWWVCKDYVEIYLLLPPSPLLLLLLLVFFPLLGVPISVPHAVNILLAFYSNSVCAMHDVCSHHSAFTYILIHPLVYFAKPENVRYLFVFSSS